MFDLILGLRQNIECGAQDEVEITGSQPLFGIWDYVTIWECRPMGSPMLRPILYV
jgi:hypothetical protein